MPQLKTGESLKQTLGLENFRNIKITRILASSYKTYLIFYNSRIPQAPITTHQVLRGYMPSMVYVYPFKKRPTMTPLMDLVDFNGPERGAFFFVVDLAGIYGSDKHHTHIVESSSLWKGKLKEFPLVRETKEQHLREFLTLADLRDTASASEMTKRFRSQRNGLLGAENRTAKLIDCVIDEGDNSVTFQFLTDVTPYDNPDHKYGETDPDNDFEIKRNRSKSYELQVKILDFFNWLDTFPEKEEITRSDIKDILDVSNVQVFNTSPAMHWQGHNWNLSQVDASIHPTDIAPTVWNQPDRHGRDAFLDKHLLGLVSQMGFFEQQMASMLTSKLKQRGLL